MGLEISMAISNKNTPEPHRKQEGDIVDIKRHPWEWGTEELKTHLIVNLELPEDMPNKKVRRLIEKMYLTDEFEDQVVDPLADREATGKRRFTLPGVKLVNFYFNQFGVAIDVSRVRDDNDDYQPVNHIVVPNTLQGVERFLKDKWKDTFASDDPTVYTDLIAD